MIGRRTALAAVGAALLGALVLALGHAVGAHVEWVLGWVDRLGSAAPAAFVVGYALATVAFVPGSVLTLAAGALFGLAGILYVAIGATAGACAAFLIARYAARGAVERRLAGDDRLAAIDRAIGRNGRTIVLLLRLSPVFPFTVLNYALGLTRVRFVDYLVASVGMLPGMVLYVYYGTVAGDLARLASGTAMPRGVGYYAVLALGLVATLAATMLVTRIARRALQEATDAAAGR
ncbi:MAG TPA: TVP38/TMEM64 family protein [Thermodesulfobacteriota bacterium]